MNFKVATPGNTRKILDKYNLNLKKKMGQNILTDKNIINIIIDSADLNEEDIVIEIGAGTGSLTQFILDTLNEKGYLIAIEKDNRFVKVLKDLIGDYENLEIVNKDVRDIKWNDFLKERSFGNESVKILGNLPYYITTPVIIQLLDADFDFSKMIFMVQKEVAERMVASPGNKTFGSLSVFVQFHAKSRIVHNVSPDVFIPQPEVNSSIIVLNPYKQCPFKVENKEFFFKMVKSIFQLRRKNIKNSLLKNSILNLDKDLIIEGLKKCNIDTKIRGEKLSIEKMVELSNIIWDIINTKGDKDEIYKSS